MDKIGSIIELFVQMYVNAGSEGMSDGGNTENVYMSIGMCMAAFRILIN